MAIPRNTPQPVDNRPKIIVNPIGEPQGIIDKILAAQKGAQLKRDYWIPVVPDLASSKEYIFACKGGDGSKTVIEQAGLSSPGTLTLNGATAKAVVTSVLDETDGNADISASFAARIAVDNQIRQLAPVDYSAHTLKFSIPIAVRLTGTATVKVNGTTVGTSKLGIAAGAKVESVIDLTLGGLDVSADFESQLSIDNQIWQTGITDYSNDDLQFTFSVSVTGIRWGKAQQFNFDGPPPISGFKVIDPDNKPDNHWEEIDRVEEDVRVENPDDPEQFVIVKKIQKISFNTDSGQIKFVSLKNK